MRSNLGVVASAHVAAAGGVSDNFNRADSATLGTSSSGVAWESPVLGTFSVSSDKAVVNNVTGDKRVLIESGLSNFTATIDMTTNTTLSNVGFTFRAASGTSFLLFTIDASNTVRLFKRAGTTYTQLASATVTLAGSTTYAVEVVASSADITISMDGTSRISHTLSGADQTTYGSNTLVGFRVDGVAVGGIRWDNLVVGT